MTTLDERRVASAAAGMSAAQLRLAALLPADVAQRAAFEHLYDRTAASALRVLAALPDTAWHLAVSPVHIDFESLLAQGGELQRRLMVRVAASLYGSPLASASAADLADLAPEYYAAVQDAIRIVREGLR